MQLYINIDGGFIMNASEIVKNKLISSGGTAKIHGINNGEYIISIM